MIEKKPSFTDPKDIQFECAVAGNALRSLRLSHGYRQQDLASKLEISTSAYSHYECGDRIPDLASLITLSNFYEININYLILLTCIDTAKKYGISSSEVFKAYSYGRTVPEDEAALLAYCSQLSPVNKENLLLFLDAAVKMS